MATNSDSRPKEQGETRREVAERIVNDLQNGPFGVVFHTTRTFESNPSIARSLINNIEAALNAERERCAKIAETVPESRFDLDHEPAQTEQQIRKGIAAAIRNEVQG